jgi:predicted HTH domain antitoxin
MSFILEDDLIQAAGLADLSPEQTKLVLAVGLFAEGRVTLARAGMLAGLDRLEFQRHLASLGIPLHYGPDGFEMDMAELSRRGV